MLYRDLEKNKIIVSQSKLFDTIVRHSIEMSDDHPNEMLSPYYPTTINNDLLRLTPIAEQNIEKFFGITLRLDYTKHGNISLTGLTHAELYVPLD